MGTAIPILAQRGSPTRSHQFPSLVQYHPREYNMEDVTNIKTLLDPKTLIKRGHAPVSINRPPAKLELYYEIHGDPSPSATRLVLVMG